jgi:preprotein translocase subunit YajC
LHRTILLAAGTLILAGSPALAQTGTAPATGTQTAPTDPTQAGTATGTQTTAPATGAATGSTTPTPGAQVHDAQGGPVGSVVSVTPQAITVDTGAHKVGLPPNAVGPDGKGGFVSSLGKAQLDAAYEQQTQQAGAQLDAKLVTGATVMTANGAATAGTVKSLDAQYVTLTTDKGDVKLPRSVFGLDASQNLIVKMTADQFTAALSQVTPAASTSSDASASGTAAASDGNATTTATTPKKRTRARR